MQQLTFNLTPRQFDALNRNSADILNLLNDLFTAGSINHWQLVYELQREFKQGGSPQVTSIAFDRVKYNAETHCGSFRVVLDINFTFGCEDVITEKHGQTSEWTFTIDLHHKTISFYSSPFVEERSTADEF